MPTTHFSPSALLKLIRFDKPIGTYLLLWPTLSALWIAAGGVPSLKLLVIFVLGTFLMRSAGCVINDLADRKVDGAVERTAARPLVTGEVSVKTALTFAAVLALLSFALVLLTNALTITLSFMAMALAATYPFMKRYTHLPQVVLGAAFSFGIPMAFAAQTEQLPKALWLLYFANLLWTVAYDTQYAMVDRDDDIKVGIKSTAILFGRYDRAIIALLQAITLILLALTGLAFDLSGIAYLCGLIGVGATFIWQQILIKDRERDKCFQGFLNNHYAGMIFFAGIALEYLLRP